ncbi:PPR repeat [Musa troglodytarum]|uniref:PPR repeat n=1 Tax=Musa troglodytarum TaxID=320322 RepID=A0A9E7EYH1_9LILI|nr:PPR repeat [Musa troglodytarum]
MQEVGIAPDEVTMVGVISACAKAGALDLGRWVHAFIDRKGIELDLEISTALIDMYAKCGAIEKAREVFDGMDVRDTMAWGSMIVGLAIHGHVKDALELFSAMLDSQVKPNHVTFIGVLSACAHSGLVSDGRRYWSTMRELGVAPLMEHYGCMVDLLCRAGRLEEAYTFVNDMPIVPNSVIWRTLLVGCKNSRTSDEAETAAEQLLQLEPLNAENYVLLANLYASRCQWDKVSRMRKKMKDHGVKVVAGCSSTEIDGFVHEFTVGDDTHPEIEEIREMLRDIAERVRRAGHEPWTSAVLHDVVEEEKESALCEHSERLAIAYGMLKTAAPVVVRVVKNLRACGDCHEVTKIISKIYGREIIVRDRVRFHRFVNGSCSCSDFW